MRNLLDSDGENKAVRSFLMLYGPGGKNSVEIGDMRYHLEASGWGGYWPEWADKAHEREHLTKAGAQSWIRHLFSLEVAAAQSPQQEPK